MSKLSKNSKRILGAAVACLMLVGWSGSSHAQCTINNWQVGGVPASEGLSPANVGLPSETAAVGGNFRRYAGPCALRVPVDSTPRYVIDGSPGGENVYKARFYAFLNNAGSDVTIFEALNAGDVRQISIVYSPTQATLDLNVRLQGGTTQTLQYTQVPTGWHSIEFEWSAGAAEDIVFALNTDDPNDKIVQQLNTTGGEISEVRLGNISGTGSAPAGSYVDFDDFDSRRSSLPGRLCRGLVTGGESLALPDAFAIYDEFASGGNVPAAGQPDFDEDGEVGLQDFFDVYGAFASGQDSCALHR